MLEYITEMNFTLKAPFHPTGDQPDAISRLIYGVREGRKHQTLLGVTGSGKTYTIANVIAELNRPTLVISHNKTLAGQLYQEFRSFFPGNAVCYFVSYYDYYQPEAYIPKTDTYIEKETEINEEIDKLRLSATANLLSRKDTLVIASVSCLYNIGSPKEYGRFILEVKKGVKIQPHDVIRRLIDLQYNRTPYGFHRGTFRVRGDLIDIFPAYQDDGIRLSFSQDRVKEIERINPISGEKMEQKGTCVIYPAKHYMADPKKMTDVFETIRSDLKRREEELIKTGKQLEAHRLRQKVEYDLEMIMEMGYVNGIENYSRYFDGRKPGDPPYTLLDYFSEIAGNDWLLCIDESHMTIPQIRGMYNGDRARKQTLIDFGFRLPAALDNRPLKFNEFQKQAGPAIYISATPAEWEIAQSQSEARKYRNASGKQNPGVVEQLIRPTGILDPHISIRPSENQIIDLVKEIWDRKKKNERVLVTTLTKRTAEDLTKFLNERTYLSHPEFKNRNEEETPVVQYLHADVETLERTDILDNLRKGMYDVIIGINLLREGLDLPEVSLVAILDADKEGFLRSDTSLIQTMGRAARHVSGVVIMYADRKTGSMERAIAEIERRRERQIEYNRTHGMTPVQIVKPFREKIAEYEDEADPLESGLRRKGNARGNEKKLFAIESDQLTPMDRTKLIRTLEREMKRAAGDLDFELAAKLRDKIVEIKAR